MAEKIVVEAICQHGDAEAQAGTLRRIADQVEQGAAHGMGWRLTETQGDV